MFILSLPERRSELRLFGSAQVIKIHSYQISIVVYKHIFNGVFLAVTAASSFAQNAPTIIPIETRQNVLVLQTDKDNHLEITYFGKKLSQPAEYKLIPSQSRQRDGNAGIYNSAYTPAGNLECLRARAAT
jgi:hypothetical protein